MSRVEPNRNVYVGHRYVPLLVGEWDKSIQYEGLSIVTFQGNSYTSKKMTPPGIDIENKEYWVLTGNYNAQIEYYRQDVQRVKEDMSELDERLTKDLSDTRAYVDDEVRETKEYVDSSVQDLTIYVNDEVELLEAEILQARIDSEGNEYTVLKDRLDTKDIEVNTHLEKMAVTVRANGTDDTDNILEASNKIIENGRGKLFLPDEEYIVNLPFGETFIEFADMDWVEIESRGFINDLTTYEPTLVEYTNLFSFSNVKRINVDAFFKSRKPDMEGDGGVSAGEGVRFLNIEDNCDNININAEAIGGRHLIYSRRDIEVTTESEKSKNINAKIKTTGTKYPYTTMFSGDNADVKIDAEESARNFFISGANNIKINVDSLDQKLSSIIKSYYGLGCENVDVFYKDKESTYRGSSAVQIIWGDVIPATHRNININLDVINSNPRGWTSTVTFLKTDIDNKPDNVSRGHILDGFTLGGYSKNETHEHVYAFPTPGSAFLGEDKFKNVKIKDFTAEGGQDIVIPFGGLSFDNVKIDGDFIIPNDYNNPSTFNNCEANSFWEDDFEETHHHYVNCRALNRDGVINKALNVSTEGYMQVSKLIEGDLSTPIELFKLRGGSRGWFKLKYYMTHQDHYYATNRSETFGVKGWTSTLGFSSLNWTLIQDVYDVVPEKVVNSPGNLNITFTDDETHGVIKISCDEYNEVESKGVFVLEYFSTQENPVLIS